MENLTVKIDDHPIVEIQTITIGPGSIGARIDQFNGMAFPKSKERDIVCAKRTFTIVDDPQRRHGSCILLVNFWTDCGSNNARYSSIIVAE